MWNRLTNLAQTVQGQFEETADGKVSAESEQFQSTSITLLRRSVLHSEVTLSSGSSLSVHELREQFDQQQQQIEQLKHLVRENERQLKDKEKELENTNAKFSKFKLQQKAKNISEKREESKKLEGKMQSKVHDSSEESGLSEQANRGKMLVIKKKLEEKEKLLTEKEKELNIKNNQIMEQQKQLTDLDLMVKRLQESEATGGVDEAQKKDYQELFAQIIYKDNKILELNNKTLQLDQVVMSLQEHVKEKEEVIQARTKAIQLIQKEIAEKDQRIEDQNTMLQKLTKHVEEDEEQLSLLKERLQNEEHTLHQSQKYFQEMLDEKSNVITSLHQKVEDLNNRYEQDKQVWSRRAKENIQDEALNRLEFKMKEKDDIIEAKNSIIEQLRKEMTDNKKNEHMFEDFWQNIQALESKALAEEEKFELILKNVREQHGEELTKQYSKIQELELQIKSFSSDGAKYMETPEIQESSQIIIKLEEELRNKEHLINELKKENENPDAGKKNTKFLKYKAQTTAKIKALQTQLDELKKGNVSAEELVSLKNQIAELEDEKGNLQLNLLDFEETKALQAHSHTQILELKTKLEQQSEDLDQHVQALSKVEKEKLNLVEHIQKLEGKLQQKQFQQNHDQEMLILSLKEELEQTRQFIVQVQQERDQERKGRVSFEMRIVEFEDYKKHAEIDIMNLAEKFEDCQCELAQVQTLLSSEESLRRRLEEEKVALEMKIVELEEQTEGVEVQKQELIRKTCRLQEHLDYEKQPNIAFETEREELIKQLELLKVKQHEYDEEKKSLLSDLNELQQRNSDLVTKLEELKVTNQDKSKEDVYEADHIPSGHQLTSLQEKSESNYKNVENDYYILKSSAWSDNALTISEELKNKTVELDMLKEKLEHEISEAQHLSHQVEEYNNKISILEAESLEKSDLITNLQSEIKEFNSTIENLNEEKDKSNTNLKEQITELQQSLDLKNEKLLQYETEIKQTEEESNKSDSQLQLLQAELQHSQEMISNLQEERSFEAKKMETKTISLLQQLSEMENEVSLLQEKNAHLQEMIKNHTDTIQNFQKELNHCQRELEEKDSIVLTTKQILEELSLNMQSKDHELKQLQSDYNSFVESSQEKVISLSQTIEEVENEKKSLLSQLDANLHAVSELEKKMVEKDTDIEKLNNELFQNIENSEELTQITTILKESLQLSEERSQNESSLRCHVEELQIQISNNAEMVSKLEEEIKHSNQNIESLEIVIQEKDQTILEVQSNLQNAKSQYQELHAFHQQEEIKLKMEKNAEESFSKEQIDNLIMELDKMKLHCQNLQQEKQHLEESCLQMAEKYTALELEVGHLNASVRDYQNNVESSQESVNRLQSQMEQQQKIIEELQRELHSSIQQHETADAFRSEVETKNKQLQETIARLKVGLKKHLKEKDELVSKLENMEIEKEQYMQEKQHFEEEVQQLQNARLELLEANNKQLIDKIKTLEEEAEHNQMSKNELAALLDKHDLEKQQLLEENQSLEKNVKIRNDEINHQKKALQDEYQIKEELTIKLQEEEKSKIYLNNKNLKLEDELKRCKDEFTTRLCDEEDKNVCLNDKNLLFENELKQCKEKMKTQKEELEALDLKQQESIIELKQLTDHLQMLQSSSTEQVQTLSLQIEKANEEIKSLNLQIISSANREKESLEDCANFKSSMNRLHDELDHALASVAQSKTENHIFKEHLLEKESELAVLQEKQGFYINLSEELKKQCEEMGKELEIHKNHNLILEKNNLESQEFAQKLSDLIEVKTLEIENVMKEKHKLSEQLAESSQQFQFLQNENSKLLKEKSDLVSLISDKDNKMEELMKENTDMSSHSKTILETESDLRKHIEFLNSKLAENEMELKREVHLVTEENSRLSLESQRVADESSKNSHELIAEIVNLKQYIKDMEAEQNNKEQLILQLQAITDAEKQKKAEYEQELGSVKEYLTILQEEREKFQENVIDYNKQIDGLQIDLSSSHEVLNLTKSELLQAQTDLCETMSAKNELLNTITALKNENFQQQEITTKADQILVHDELQLKVGELTTELDTVNNKLYIINNENLDLKEQIKIMDNELCQSFSEKQQYNQLVDELNHYKAQVEEISTYKLHCFQLSEMISELEQEKQKKTDLLSELERELAESRNSILELNLNNDRLQELLKESMESSSLKSSLDNDEALKLKECCRELKNSLVEEKEQIQKLSIEIEVKDELINNLKQHSENLEKEKQGLQDILDQKESVLVEIEKNRSPAVAIQNELLVQSSLPNEKCSQNYESFIKEHEELKLLYERTKIKSEKMLIKLKHFKDRNDKLQEVSTKQQKEISELKTCQIQEEGSHQEIIGRFENHLQELKEKVHTLEIYIEKQNVSHGTEINSLQSTISNLEAEIDSFNDDYKLMKSDFQRLSEGKKTIEKEKERISAENWRLTEQLEQIQQQREKELDEARTMIENLQCQINESSANLEISAENKERWEREMKTTSEQMQQLIEDNENFQCLVENLTIAKNKFEEEIKTQKKSYIGLSLENQQLKDKFEKWQSLQLNEKQSSENLLQDLDQLKFNLEDIQNKYDELKVYYDDLLIQKEELEKQNVEKGENYSQVEIENKKLQIELMTFHEDNNKMRQDFENLINDYQKINSDYDSLKHELETLTTEKEISTQNYNQRINELTVENDKLQKELEVLNKDYHTLKVDKESYNQKLHVSEEFYEHQLFDLQQRDEKLTAELVSMRQSSLELKQQYNIIEEECEGLRKLLQQRDNHVLEKSQHIERLALENSQLENHIKHWQRQQQDVRQGARNLENNSDPEVLEKEMYQTMQSLHLKELRVEELTSQIAQLLDEKSSLAMQLNNISRLKQDGDNQIFALKNQHKTLESALHHRENDVKTLQRQLQTKSPTIESPRYVQSPEVEPSEIHALLKRLETSEYLQKAAEERSSLLEKELSAEREQRIQFQDELNRTQERLKRESQQAPVVIPEFILSMDSDDQTPKILETSHTLSRQVSSHAAKIKKWLSRRNPVSRALRSRSILHILYIFYVILLHMAVLHCYLF